MIILNTVYFLFFATLGVLIPYLSIYMFGIGYNSQTIGIAMSIIGFVRIFSPIIWEHIGNKFLKDNRHKIISIISSIGIFVTLLILIFVRNKFIFYTIFFILNFFWSAILSQIENIALNYSVKFNINYSKIRIWGSIGYIASTIATSLVITKFGSNSFVYLLIIFDFILIYFIFKIKDNESSVIKSDFTEDNNKIKFKLNEKIILFLLITFLTQASLGPFYSFFVPFVNKFGWSTFDAGLMISIGVIAEIIVFNNMRYLISKYSLKSLFIFSMLCTMLRWFLFAQFANYGIAIWVGSILHCTSYASIHVVSMEWILKNTTHDDKFLMQAMYNGLGFGGGGAIGAGIAGFLWNNDSGSSNAFYFAFFCVLFALPLCLMLFSKKNKKLSIQSKYQ